MVSGPGTPLDAPPGPADLRVPAREAPVLARLVADLGLESLPPPARVRAVAGYFRTRFAYTAALGAPRPGAAALEDFLLRSRAGHCEYFATATLLLLRAAGIPARYAVGYAVVEPHPLEGRYVVRARHAHAWALVYRDGGWRDLDTTPPAWVGAEAADAPAWQALYDLSAWVFFAVSRWRWGETEGGGLRLLAWLLLPLGLFLAARLRLRRWGRAAAAPALQRRPPRVPARTPSSTPSSAGSRRGGSRARPPSPSAPGRDGSRPPGA